MTSSLLIPEFEDTTATSPDLHIHTNGDSEVTVSAFTAPHHGPRFPSDLFHHNRNLAHLRRWLRTWGTLTTDPAPADLREELVHALSAALVCVSPRLDPCMAPARTPLGRRLRDLRRKIIESGQPLLGWDELGYELRERRGLVDFEEEF